MKGLLGTGGRRLRFTPASEIHCHSARWSRKADAVSDYEYANMITEASEKVMCHHDA